MKLATNKNFNMNTSFKAAMVNINALSDIHGHIHLSDAAFQELNDRKADVFCKEEKGNANILAICGDWFIDGDKKGYYSAPKRKRAFFQKDMLSAFIAQIKEITPKVITLFTPGNHEFDGGVPLLDKILSSLDLEVLMTNLHLPTSNGLIETKKANKLINQKIVEVEDDKNPNLKHKVLFLGISPVNLRKYQKDCTGIELIENWDIAQAKVEEHNYQATMSDCIQRINEFKKENPKGVVILMSHTGVGFADNLAKRVPVDFVFDAHEHKDKIRYSNKTPIIPLSQNFKKIVNLKVKFDDMGNFSTYELNSYNPSKNNKRGKLTELYNSIFEKDIMPQYSVITNNPNINKLRLENIREGNNFLANFITDSVLEEIRKEQPNVDFFGLNSSAIRGELKVSETAGISHSDLMSVLSGIKEREGHIMITRMTGKEVLDLVLDNVLFNNGNPQKNPIMQYSGLAIDKTSILKSYEMGFEVEDLSEFVIDTNTGKSIDIKKEYIFANTEKFFDKSDNSQIIKMKKRSFKLGYNVQTLFERHFETSTNSLFAKCDVRYK